MKTSQLHFNETNLLRPLASDYINQKAATQTLYTYTPDAKGIAKALEDRRTIPVDRDVLVQALKAQYLKTGIKAPAVDANINLLQQGNTFTITTGHQLNLFGGTQYFIYKIVEVINYTKELAKRFPEDHFIPVFWMATEDHDFDEINHVVLNGERREWNTEHGGPVGRLDPAPILKTIEELSDFWDSSVPGARLKKIFSEAYKQPTLADATRHWVHELFASHGLVIIDGDDTTLKRPFLPVVKREILEQTTFSEVEKTNEFLSEKGYHIQATPRAINLFYIEDGIRDRLVEVAGEIGCFEDGRTWDKSSFLNHIESHPEKVSPNALMRPMYQETILPNLAYVGGAGEIAYWLQSKSAFEKNDTYFPQLIIRNSAIWINNRIQKKASNIDLSISDFFQKKERLLAEFAESHRSGKALFEQASEIEKLWKTFQETSSQTFTNLRVKTGVFAAEQLHELKKLKQDMRKLVKLQNASDIEVIEQMYETIFPMGVFQERIDTFLPAYLELGDSYFNRLFEHIQPAGHQTLVFNY